MNGLANEYLGITVSVLMFKMFPAEIEMRNVTSLGNITKKADSKVSSSGLPLDPQ